jgi:hypothetical protein
MDGRWAMRAQAREPSIVHAARKIVITSVSGVPAEGAFALGGVEERGICCLTAAKESRFLASLVMTIHDDGACLISILMGLSAPLLLD